MTIESEPGGPARSWAVWTVWIPITLTVFVFVPNLMAGNFLPKTGWLALWTGVALLVCPYDRSGRLALTPLSVIWVAYVGWALVSLSWAEQAWVGFDRWLLLALFAAVYLVARRSRFWESETYWRFFVGVFIAFCIIGVVEFRAPDWPLIRWLPGDKRPRLTLGNPNYVGFYLSLTLPFVAWRLFREARRTHMITALIAVLLGLLVLLFSRTRGSWLAVACLIPLATTAPVRARLWARRVRLLMLAGAVAVSLCVGLLLRPSVSAAAGISHRRVSLWSVVESSLEGERDSNRLTLWRSALRIPISRLTGCGFGNFAIVATPYDETGRVLDLTWEIHNDYLQNLVDLGIPGLALYLALCAVLLRLFWRRRNEGIALAAGMAIVAWMVNQSFNWTIQKVSSHVWIAASAAILNSASGLAPIWQRPVPRAWTRAVSVAMAGALFALTVAISMSAWGDWRFRRAILSLRDEAAPLPDMKVLSTRVLPRMPFCAEVIHINAYQWARLAMEAGDFDSAERFARRAIRLHPSDRTALSILAQLALQQGRTQEAIGHLERIITAFGYESSDLSYYETLASLYEKEGRETQARQVVERARNHALLRPSHPRPCHNASGVSVETTLGWASCKAAEGYQLYLWKVGEDRPLKPVFGDLESGEDRTMPALSPGTTYIWQVKALGHFRGVPRTVTGDQWVFKTQPETPPPAEDANLEDRLRQADNIVDLSEIALAAGIHMTGRRPEERVYTEQFERLTAQLKPWRSIHPAVSLYGFGYRRVADRRYRCYYLFRVNEALREDCRIHVEARVDSCYEHLLAPVGQQTGVAAWHFDPEPPTSQWKPGTFVLLDRTVRAEDVPYQISIGLYSRDRGFLGEKVDLGWWADPGPPVDGEPTG